MAEPGQAPAAAPSSSGTWQERLFAATKPQDAAALHAELDDAVTSIVSNSMPPGKSPSDPEFVAALERALKLSQQEKAQLLADVEDATRIVVEPVITAALELAGVDPRHATDADIERALGGLTPEQAELLQQIHDEGMEEALEPLARELLEGLGDEGAPALAAACWWPVAGG